MGIAIPPNNGGTHGVLMIDKLPFSKCERIKSLSNTSIKRQGKVQTKNSDKTEKIVSIRQVDTWIVHEKETWLDEMLIDIVLQANKTFDYNISGLIERPQLLRYNYPSVGYDWHTDIGNGDASTRKISCSIILNEDFEGGNLEFFQDGIFSIENNSLGNIFCFSSFIPHRVTKITKGHRWSLVAWVSGPSFK